MENKAAKQIFSQRDILTFTTVYTVGCKPELNVHIWGRQDQWGYCNTRMKPNNNPTGSPLLRPLSSMLCLNLLSPSGIIQTLHIYFSH